MNSVRYSRGRHVPMPSVSEPLPTPPIQSDGASPPSMPAYGALSEPCCSKINDNGIPMADDTESLSVVTVCSPHDLPPDSSTTDAEIREQPDDACCGSAIARTICSFIWTICIVAVFSVIALLAACALIGCEVLSSSVCPVSVMTPMFLQDKHTGDLYQYQLKYEDVDLTTTTLHHLKLNIATVTKQEADAGVEYRCSYDRQLLFAESLSGTDRRSERQKTSTAERTSFEFDERPSDSETFLNNDEQTLAGFGLKCPGSKQSLQLELKCTRDGGFNGPWLQR